MHVWELPSITTVCQPSQRVRQSNQEFKCFLQKYFGLLGSAEGFFFTSTVQNFCLLFPEAKLSDVEE